MAKRISTIVIDDLTGAELGEEAVTLTFALDGAVYEIDLAPTGADHLRETLQPFIGVARKVGRASSGRRTSSLTPGPTGEQSAARAWLLEQGVDAPSRGRLPAALLEQYRTR